MQTKQLHIRLTCDEMKVMEDIAKECEINVTMLGGFFIRAALRAAKTYGKRITLPPHFEMADGPVELQRFNESPPASKSRK
jgi:hypothetical protein